MMQRSSLRLRLCQFKISSYIQALRYDTKTLVTNERGNDIEVKPDLTFRQIELLRDWYQVFTAALPHIANWGEIIFEVEFKF